MLKLKLEDYNEFLAGYYPGQEYQYHEGEEYQYDKGEECQYGEGEESQHQEISVKRRIILASNAPPFHLEEYKPTLYKKDKPKKKPLLSRIFGGCKNVDIKTPEKEPIKQGWHIEQASGGLVSAVMPVMESDRENVLIELPKFTNYYQEISNCILWPALHNIYRNVLINKETGLALD
uniref:Uncharacterized protein n=1 Tax=Meloidogyne javanica TaxID=6303 RepID=A0A915LZ93_MELJA